MVEWKLKVTRASSCLLTRRNNCATLREWAHELQAKSKLNFNDIFRLAISTMFTALVQVPYRNGNPFTCEAQAHRSQHTGMEKFTFTLTIVHSEPKLLFVDLLARPLERFSISKNYKPKVIAIRVNETRWWVSKLFERYFFWSMRWSCFEVRTSTSLLQILERCEQNLHINWQFNEVEEAFGKCFRSNLCLNFRYFHCNASKVKHRCWRLLS